MKRFRFPILALIFTTALAFACGDGTDGTGKNGKGLVRTTSVRATVVRTYLNGRTYAENVDGTDTELPCVIDFSKARYEVLTKSYQVWTREDDAYHGPGSYRAEWLQYVNGGVDCSLTVDPGELSGRYACVCDLNAASRCTSDDVSRIEVTFECVGEFSSKSPA